MRIRSSVALLALAFVTVIAVAGPALAATRSVSEVDFDFSPAAITVNVGDTIVWTNNGASPHTTTSDGGIWDSGLMNPGDTFSRTFNAAGTFPYHCTFHQAQGMVGTVTVVAGGTAPGGPTLPNTGPGTSIGPFVWLGLLFLVAGGAVLFAIRRRTA